ncbi:hypothetical protein AQ619_18240 (plasmid) [Caulobacter henricii]|uniref:Antitoxin Xre/MbcA/ParS-like toxin-binding domain-containing protein n=2 Tax=Caulobacter henricii TaxID=69395 RepID=A0A0P0P4Y2_9CAUL|nr:hypothetical protein AQ619_18240 [Caulobacter henricii]
MRTMSRCMNADLDQAHDAELLLASGRALSGSELASTVQQIADRSGDILGSKEHAYTWLQSHLIPAFGGKTAQQIIAQGWGQAILDYLDELRYGGRG